MRLIAVVLLIASTAAYARRPRPLPAGQAAKKVLEERKKILEQCYPPKNLLPKPWVEKVALATLARVKEAKQ
jgi:hypothetical protein